MATLLPVTLCSLLPNVNCFVPKRKSMRLSPDAKLFFHHKFIWIVTLFCAMERWHHNSSIANSLFGIVFQVSSDTFSNTLHKQRQCLNVHFLFNIAFLFQAASEASLCDLLFDKWTHNIQNNQSFQLCPLKLHKKSVWIWIVSFWTWCPSFNWGLIFTFESKLMKLESFQLLCNPKWGMALQATPGFVFQTTMPHFLWEHPLFAECTIDQHFVPKFVFTTAAQCVQHATGSMQWMAKLCHFDIAHVVTFHEVFWCFSCSCVPDAFSSCSLHIGHFEWVEHNFLQCKEIQMCVIVRGGNLFGWVHHKFNKNFELVISHLETGHDLHCKQSNPTLHWCFWMWTWWKQKVNATHPRWQWIPGQAFFLNQIFGFQRSSSLSISALQTIVTFTKSSTNQTVGKFLFLWRARKRSNFMFSAFSVLSLNVVNQAQKMIASDLKHCLICFVDNQANECVHCCFSKHFCENTILQKERKSSAFMLTLQVSTENLLQSNDGQLILFCGMFPRKKMFEVSREKSTFSFGGKFHARNNTSNSRIVYINRRMCRAQYD